MKKIVCIFLVICNFILTVPSNAYAQERPDENELFSKSAVLMDADSGRILYEKNGTEALANASTTKILTCIITLETCNLDSEVEVSSRAASAPRVHLGMRTGQKFYLEDLLYGLMLESFNDCAVAIAEYIAGSVEDFSKIMNDKAAEIGCRDTYFLTPNGLDASDANGQHHTTAEDLALIMRYCIKESKEAEKFLEITRTSQYQIIECTTGACYGCYNHNAFLTMMEGALSGKTGFTGSAGYCYVGALQRDGRTYIVALLACGWPNNKSYKWSDTKKLMQYGIDNFFANKVEETEFEQSKLEKVLVEDGQTERIDEQAYIELEVEKCSGVENFLMSEEEQLTIDYQIAGKLMAPVKKGEYVGKISVRIGTTGLAEYSVLAKNDVKKRDYAWCLAKVWGMIVE